MFTVRLKHVNKDKQCEKLKKSSFLFCLICISVLSFFFFFFGQAICCWGTKARVLQDFPYSRQPYVAGACLVHQFSSWRKTFPGCPSCCADPSLSHWPLHSECRGWVVFLVSGSYDVGRSKMFQHCPSSGNFCEGHLRTADWRSWALIGGT